MNKENELSKVYLIGNAHLDPVWLWRRAEGMSEILSTFRSALERMKEFPDYIFTSACPSYFKWIEEVDPDMFEEIRLRVKEGRINLVGGFWVQPDLNLPSGESLARHLLYSQRYFMEKFQVVARTGYNVDSFGHNAMLPQLLQKSGITSYIFMRPDPGESALEENVTLPGELFFWESPDGSRVMAARINQAYNDEGPQCPSMTRYPGMHPSVSKALFLKDQAIRDGIPCLSFYGIGNHGGGPTIAGLRALTKLLESDRREGIRYAHAQDLFTDVSRAGLSLPEFRGDLQHHASGCYAAASEIKKSHRKAENALLCAERFAAFDSILTQTPASVSVSGSLRDAWETLLFHEFHDILAGCCIKSACDEAVAAFQSVSHRAEDIAMLAASRISWRVCTSRLPDLAPAEKNGWQLWEKEGEGAPVVIFNPHSFPVDTCISVNSDVCSICDSSGTPVPTQRVRGEQTNGGDLYNTLFPVQLPAFGYTTCYLYRTVRKKADAPLSLSAGTHTLENHFVRITFDPARGLITGMFDKKASRELIDPARPLGQALVLDDQSNDTWAHGVFRFDKEMGAFEFSGMTLLEQGPLRAAVEALFRYGESELRIRYALYYDSPILHMDCTLSLRQPHVQVKLCFPAALDSPDFLCSIPYGFLVKGTDGVEEPAQKWVALSEPGTGYGIALINDCKHSFCAVQNELRVMVARSAIYADHFGHRDGHAAYQDMAPQQFCLRLLPFSSEKQEEAVRAALLLAMAPRLVMDTHHGGALPNRLTGICISRENILCTAFKAAEDGEGYILRLVECAGRPCSAGIDVLPLHASIQLTFRGQEIKTIRLCADGTWKEEQITEMIC